MLQPIEMRCATLEPARVLFTASVICTRQRRCSHVRCEASASRPSIAIADTARTQDLFEIDG